jgi:hypothetical protein
MPDMLYTVPGTYSITFTGKVYLSMYLIGGGGGGGDTSPTVSTGGAGQGGCETTALAITVTAGTYSVTVGDGGAINPGDDGSPGADTTVTIGAITYGTGNGGEQGYWGGNRAMGGQGGSASVGTHDGGAGGNGDGLGTGAGPSGGGGAADDGAGGDGGDDDGFPLSSIPGGIGGLSDVALYGGDGASNQGGASVAPGGGGCGAGIATPASAGAAGQAYLFWVSDAPPASSIGAEDEDWCMMDYSDCVSRIRFVQTAGSGDWTSLTASNPYREAIAIFGVTADGIAIANDKSVAVASAAGLLPVGYPVWFHRCRAGSVVQDAWFAASTDCTTYGVIEVIREARGQSQSPSPFRQTPEIG